VIQEMEAAANWGQSLPPPEAGRVVAELCPGGYLLEPGGSGDEDIPP